VDVKFLLKERVNRYVQGQRIAAGQFYPMSDQKIKTARTADELLETGAAKGEGLFGGGIVYPFVLKGLHDGILAQYGKQIKISNDQRPVRAGWDIGESGDLDYRVSGFIFVVHAVPYPCFFLRYSRYSEKAKVMLFAKMIGNDPSAIP